MTKRSTKRRLQTCGYWFLRKRSWTPIP